jgi:hypothetical protein
MQVQKRTHLHFLLDDLLVRQKRMVKCQITMLNWIV